jgi:hypothetical protein
MPLHSTYSVKEALLLMCELDMEGLDFMWEVVSEEKDRYSHTELGRLKKVYNYCVLTEKRNKRLL